MRRLRMWSGPPDLPCRYSWRHLVRTWEIREIRIAGPRGKIAKQTHASALLGGARLCFLRNEPTRPVFFFLRDFSVQTQFTVSYCNFKEILATASGV